ncbi:MAG: DUF2975 domain-containing protein, partial [Salinivirgaceae bacterium]|nr:DUF2975 domain-containing protein [Salinivirgaceae bacterium]
MNKKLKIYSGLFLGALLVTIVTNVFHFNRSFTTHTSSDEKLEFVDGDTLFASCDTLTTGGVVKRFNRTFSMEVFVKPKAGAKSLCSTAAGQIYKVDLQKVKLIVPTDKDTFFKYPIVFIFVSSALSAIITIWILVIALKLIRSIRKGEVFVTQVSKYIETTGILLLVRYVYGWFVYYVVQHYIINNVRMAGYDIV